MRFTALLYVLFAILLSPHATPAPEVPASELQARAHMPTLGVQPLPA